MSLLPRPGSGPLAWNASRFFSRRLALAARTLRRETARAALAGLLVWALLLGACSVATDAEFYPPATDPPFAVTAVTLSRPADQSQPLNPTITLRLSDLPDPATVQFPALRLSTRTQSLEILAEVSLADRQLRLRPKKQLLPENDYFVVLSQEVAALSGQPLLPVTVPFRTGSFVDPDPVREPPVDLNRLLTDPAGLRARCALVGCHSARDAGGGLTAAPAQGLSFDLAAPALADFLAVTPARGSVEGLLLVQPGVPERSYLLRKLVAPFGFARITGSPMPPPPAPTSMPQSLDEVLLRSLELWIRQGAR